MITPKTPEQIEDAAITDIIRTTVALRMRKETRRLQNDLLLEISPKVERARLDGKKVDLNKLVVEALNAIASQ